jgi:hypothetical protein
MSREEAPSDCNSKLLSSLLREPSSSSLHLYSEWLAAYSSYLAGFLMFSDMEELGFKPPVPLRPPQS